MQKDVLLEKLYRRDWIFDSPLEPVVISLLSYLRKEQYADNTVSFYLKAIAHFAHWAKAQSIDLRQIDKPLCERFIKEHLPVCTCPAPRSIDVTCARTSLSHLRMILRRDGLGCADFNEATLLSGEINQYHHYLASTCGLAPNTCEQRLKIVRMLLSRYFGSSAIDLSTLQAEHVDDFLSSFAKRWKPASLGVVRGAVRSYLRYRSLQGDKTENIALALPLIASWKGASLPKALTEKQVQIFLAAFDLSNAAGLRDFAIARCLLDLGLRGHELAHLTLESLDWRSGTMTVSSSKGKRVRELPLPWQTGAALASYLKNARPKTESRVLFVRNAAPLAKPLSVAGIRGAMRRAFERCGLGDQFCNTHVFRHTLAVRLQDSGSSLKEIADILRHKNLESTAIYAKVDLKSLRKIALPWPGRRS